MFAEQANISWPLARAMALNAKAHILVEKIRDKNMT